MGTCDFEYDRVMLGLYMVYANHKGEVFLHEDHMLIYSVHFVTLFSKMGQNSKVTRVE